MQIKCLSNKWINHAGVVGRWRNKQRTITWQEWKVEEAEVTNRSRAGNTLLAKLILGFRSHWSRICVIDRRVSVVVVAISHVAVHYGETKKDSISVTPPNWLILQVQIPKLTKNFLDDSLNRTGSRESFETYESQLLGHRNESTPALKKAFQL